VKDGEPAAESSALWYSVAALAVLDVGVGFWLHLHAPQAIPKLSVTNVALIGLGGLGGLLPSDWGVRVRTRAVDLLRRRTVARALWGILAVALFVALFVSSVSVTSEGGAALLFTLDGAEGDAQDSVPDTVRLSRAKPEAHVLKGISPFGRRIWAYAPGFVSKETRTMSAWRPAHWEFPDDFDSVVTVTFLPAPSADFFLRHFPAKLILRERDATVLLEAPLTPQGVQVLFEGKPPGIRGLSKRWMDSLLKLNAGDTTAVQGRLKVWQGIVSGRARRPLHQGESGVTYEIRYADGVNGPTPLELDSAIIDVLLDDAAVTPPPKRPPPD